MKQPGVSTRGNRQSSLYVVAYDIPDDKRRTQVHKTLKGFGEWTEFSLFECFLTKKELLQMRAKLDNPHSAEGLTEKRNSSKVRKNAEGRTSVTGSRVSNGKTGSFGDRGRSVSGSGH